MSTKIYNGYRMRTLNTLELQEFVSELRERLKEVLFDKFDKTFSIIVSSYIHELNVLDDEYKETKDATKIEKFLDKLYRECYLSISNVIENNYFPKEKPNIEKIKKSLSYSYFGSLYEIVETEIKNRCEKIKVTNKSDVSHDFISDFCMFPRDEKYTLFLVYGRDFEDLIYNICYSRKKKDKIFRSKYGLEYYGYWNNTDKPNNLTNKAWNKRRDDWDFLTGVPSMTGIPIDILSYEAFFDEISLKRFKGKPIVTGKYFLPIDELAKTYAKSKIKNNFILEETKKNNKELTVSECMNLSDMFEDLFEEKNEEIMKNYNDLVLHYKDILSEISLELALNSVMSFLPNYVADNPIKDN